MYYDFIRNLTYRLYLNETKKRKKQKEARERKVNVDSHELFILLKVKDINVWLGVWDMKKLLENMNGLDCVVELDEDESR